MAANPNTVSLLPPSICKTIQKECNEMLKPNQLVSVNELPSNIQKLILERNQHEHAENEEKLNGHLYLIQIPTATEQKTDDRKTLDIYWSAKSIDNEFEKQKLRNKVLQIERDRLQQQLNQTKNSLKRDTKMIDILHKYNEIKDVAQELMGSLNQTRGCMTKDLYDEFGLDLND